MERSKAEKLAHTLDYLVKQGIVPGLLPGDVTEAAQLLRDQDAELATLRRALASKHHSVNAGAKRQNYKTKIRAEFIIADPRLYYAEMQADDLRAYGSPPHDWELHVARQLVRVGTADWVREMEEMAFIAVRKAIASVDTLPKGQDRDGLDRVATKARCRRQTPKRR